MDLACVAMGAMVGLVQSPATPRGNTAMTAFDKYGQHQALYQPDLQSSQPPPGEPATLVPAVVQGNFKHIPPGQSARLLQWNSADRNASVYSVAVFPQNKFPLSLFNGVSGSGQPVADFDEGVARYSVPHRALIEWGVGGSVTESVFVDLRRGFVLSVPASTITVTAYNVFDPAVFTDAERFSIDVGASVGLYPAHNNDGLSLTSAVFDHDPALGAVEFPVPPHAARYWLFVHQSAPPGTLGGHAVHHFQSTVTSPPLGSDLVIWDVNLPAQNTPYGPFPIAGNAAVVGVNSDDDVTHLDFNVVWEIGL